MAKVVLGIGTSRGPMLNMPPEEWHRRVEADRQNPALHFRGRPYRFEELLERRAGEHLERQITIERQRERHAACQRAIRALGDILASASPDVAVIVADDQREVFLDDNRPAFCVYWGERLDNVPIPAESQASRSPGISVADSGYYPPQPVTVPGEPGLARHLITSLMREHFDLAQSHRLPAGCFGTHGIGHAFCFVYRRIMRDRVIPNVPVWVNATFPPNQPSVSRCWELGKALGRAIRSWDSDKTVAVIVSGGLSHFVIEEDLDQQVLAAIREKDERGILDLPENRLESGTAEIRDWIVAAGALAETDLRMQLVDYVTCYRSSAGTGGAQAFAAWR